MATIRSQMVLNDGMTGVLRKITHMLDSTIKAFEDMQQASGQAVDTKLFKTLHVEAAQINSDLNRMGAYYDKIAQSQKQLNTDIQIGARGAASLTSQIGKLAAGVGLGVGFKKLLGLSDQITGTNARLSFMVDDGGTVSELEKKIMASAQRSRAAYLDTADAIASMGSNAGAAFGSNDELIAFMEQVNKQFAIGGASAQGQSAAMLQLTQAMAAGALRGEELNSILENAPGIARAIEQYMGIAEGSIKQYAQEGQVTAEVVKSALFSVADETNAKFESMPMTWAQIWTSMQNQALSSLQPVLKQLNDIANSQQFNKVVSAATNAFAALASAASQALTLLFNVGAAVVDNWGMIEPIVMGVAAAMLIYNGYLLTNSALTAINNIQKGIAAVQAYKAAAANTALSISEKNAAMSKAAATAAQYGFNAALLACPLTWILVAIIAVIAAVYAIVAAINKAKGTTISATGVITGAFAALGAFVLNRTVVPIWNAFASVANFLGNVFNNPMAAIKIAVLDMVITVMGYLSRLAHAIENLLNKIPGVTVDITSGLDNFYSGLEEAQKAAKDESGWVEYVKKMDLIDYGDAYKKGYDWGKGVQDKVGDMFSFSGLSDAGTGFDLSSIAGNTAAIADSTGGMAKSLDVSNEQLQYLRDIAERDAINRFTTAEVKIDMTGMNNRIEGSADLDGVISQLTDGFAEALVTAAEGVHA